MFTAFYRYRTWLIRLIVIICYERGAYMKELGEYLKRTRISNGVSVTEACEDLELSTSHLENIESGNIRAFKDVYELRDNVKAYAKYLCYCLRNNLLDELECANNLQCKKLYKKYC